MNLFCFVVKSSSKKSLQIGKRNYAEMKEAISHKDNKTLHYFGFNERVPDDDGYDSEPNLEHIFAKYLVNIDRSIKKKKYFRYRDAF